MSELGSKRILLGLTGGIAAYKSAELVRELQRCGADIQVVMTDSACKFITPLTLQALSGKPVYVEMWMQIGHRLAQPLGKPARPPNPVLVEMVEKIHLDQRARVRSG